MRGSRSRSRTRSSPAGAVVVLVAGLLVLGAWWLADRQERAGRHAPRPERGAASSVDSAPAASDAILGTSWTLIERWSTLNERCSRLHEHLQSSAGSSASDLAAAEEATWADLKEAYDAVMRVASTLEQADRGARDGDEARSENHLGEARGLIERSEVLLRRADERLSAVGY